MIAFSMGLPSHTPIYVEGYGFGQLVRHNENGTVGVLLAINGAVWTLDAGTRWRYA